MSVESYLAWVCTLRGKRGAERLAAILQRYPRGVPLRDVRFLMNNPSRRALDRLVDEAVRQGKAVFVCQVDTACVLIEDEDERRVAQGQARARLDAWRREGQVVREAAVEHKLLLWQGCAA